MSNLEDRNDSRTYYLEPHTTPAYPKLGPAVEKHRRLNDDTPEGRKAYGQAVHAAIRALQRRELFSAAYERASLPRDTGKMTDAQFMAHLRNNANTLRNVPSEPKSEGDYYRALFASRGIDVQTIIDLANAEQSDRITTWLKAAWNVIKTKRGTPYLAVAEYICGDGKRFATKGKAIEYANRVHLNTGIIIAVEPAPQPEATEPAPPPKKRGRPFGSKNKPKLVAKPEPVAEPKPVKPRVPSHYLSSASRAAYHAAM
jgi:hypothetical protein